MNFRRAIIYVEGSSDKAAMEALFESLITQKLYAGIKIEFLVAPGGDHKKSLLLTIPQRAARIIANDPNIMVVVMPDLYPRNKGFQHETFEEMSSGIQRNFESALKKIGRDEKLYNERFRVFCFKYDLEALVLASPNVLASRLGVDELAITWTLPVEDQNHDTPPKRIVEALYQQHGEYYVENLDAPLIISDTNYSELAIACPQQFKPFVDFLESL